jgi:paired amphipathic helix protein Sin3a
MTQKNFYKSLDHQGLIIKAIDKKLFNPKALQNEITTAYEQQQKARVKSLDAPKYQLSFSFKDLDVVVDTAHLLLVYFRAAFPPSTPDNMKMESWVKEFIPLFFDIDPNEFNSRIANIDDDTPPNEGAEEDTPTPDGGSSRGRRAAAAKKQDLRRGLLDRRNGNFSRVEGSNVGSKESTPDVSSAVEDDIPGTESPVEDAVSTDVTNNKWMDHPPLGNMRNQRDIGLTTPYKRETYNMYSNGHMYSFMRLFEILYERLLGIKDEEDDVQEDARRSNMDKAANGLGMADKRADQYFINYEDHPSYYSRILAMVEDFLRYTDPSLPQLEDVLRRFYPKSGAKLHSIDKLSFALAKAAQSTVTNDVKDKSWEIMYLFMRDREKEETTHAAEVQIRKQAEKFCKEGEMYRIAYVSCHPDSPITISYNTASHPRSSRKANHESLPRLPALVS